MRASEMPYWLPLRGQQGWYVLQMSKGGSLEEQSALGSVMVRNSNTHCPDF